MVSNRCKEKIEKELIALDLMVSEIDQGILEFEEELTAGQLFQLKEVLSELGYEVVDVLDGILLDRVSELITELVYRKPELPRQDYPAYLTKKLGLDYSEVVNLFLQVYEIELSQYIDIQHVERVKEMLLYENRTIPEIVAAFRYENAAELAKLFKKITGLTPSYYEEIKKMRLDFRNKMNPD
jgi:AraC-like DNA-binding protein